MIGFMKKCLQIFTVHCCGEIGFYNAFRSLLAFCKRFLRKEIERPVNLEFIIFLTRLSLLGLDDKVDGFRKNILLHN